MFNHCSKHVPTQAVTSPCWHIVTFHCDILPITAGTGCLQPLPAQNGTWEKWDESPQAQAVVGQGCDSRSPVQEVKPQQEFGDQNLSKYSAFGERCGLMEQGGEGLFPWSHLPFGDALRAIHGSLMSADSRKSCRAGCKIMYTKELTPNYLEG